MKEERKLQAFENRVFKKTFEPRKDEISGEFRILHNEGEPRWSSG